MLLKGQTPTKVRMKKASREKTCLRGIWQAKIQSIKNCYTASLRAFVERMQRDQVFKLRGQIRSSFTVYGTSANSEEPDQTP